MSQFATGVVVTGLDPNMVRLWGLLHHYYVTFAGVSFSSISHKTNISWPRIRFAGTFCVNALNQDQCHISDALVTAGGVPDIVWHPAPGNGAPIFRGDYYSD